MQRGGQFPKETSTKPSKTGSNADLYAMRQNETWNPISSAVSAVTDATGKVLGPIGEFGIGVAQNILGSANRLAGPLVDQPVLIDTPWLHDPKKDWVDSKGNFRGEEVALDVANVFGPKVMGKATDLAAAGIRDIAKREVAPALKTAGEWIGNAFRGGESAPKPPSGGTSLKGPESPFKPKGGGEPDFTNPPKAWGDEPRGGDSWTSGKGDKSGGSPTVTPAPEYAMSGARTQTSSAFRDSNAPLKLENPTYASNNVNLRVKDYTPRAGQYQDSAPTITRPRPTSVPDAAPKTAPLTEPRPVRESTTVAPIAPVTETKDETQAAEGSSVNTPTKPSAASLAIPALSLGNLRAPKEEPKGGLQPQPAAEPASSNNQKTNTAVGEQSNKKRTPDGGSFEMPKNDIRIPKYY